MSDKPNKTDIDFDFISKLEGNSLHGYVPDPENSQSGVTIASGFDLGQCSLQDIEVESTFNIYLVEKLSPYLGMKKSEAESFLKDNPLEITEHECTIINAYTHSTAEKRLRHAWDSSLSTVKFDNLSGPCKTVIASVSFQYGDLARRTPNFWKQVTTSDWQGALSNLRNFGDSYSTRRKKEADLLESWLLSPKVESAGFNHERIQSVAEVLEECLIEQKENGDNVLEIVIMTRYKDGSMAISYSGEDDRGAVNMLIDDAKMLNLGMYKDVGGE